MNSVYVVRSKCNYGDASIERIFEAKEDAVAMAKQMAEALGAVDTTEEDLGDMGGLVASWTGKEDYIWVTEHAVVPAEVKLPGGKLKKAEMFRVQVGPKPGPGDMILCSRHLKELSEENAREMVLYTPSVLLEPKATTEDCEICAHNDGRTTVVCSCIKGEEDCPYCKGTGRVHVRVIGDPYPTE